MFRLYDSLASEHLYTTSKYEYDALPGMTHGDWVQEGIAWIAPDEGNPVYRLYNSGLGDHHYTVNVSERNTLIAYHGWLDEGIAFYSAREPDGYAVYRVYNGGLKWGTASLHTQLFRTGCTGPISRLGQRRRWLVCSGGLLTLKPLTLDSVMAGLPQAYLDMVINCVG